MVTKEDIYGNTTNEERLRTLLDPPAKSGRVRIVERPHLLPRRCAITGRYQDDFFIDLGIDTSDFMGQIYLSAAIVANIAKISGFVRRDEYIAQLESNANLSADAISLLEENQQLKETLNELVSILGNDDSPYLADRVRAFGKRITNEVAKNDALKSSRERETTESGPDEQSPKQELGNISVFSLGKPGATPII